jgi:hypothetical protein
MCTRLAAIDIGAKHTAIALFENHLTNFDLFPLTIPSDYKHLHNFDEFWNKCQLIVIEQQMRSNVVACQVEACLKLWFHLYYPHVKVSLFCARLKYKGMDREIYNTQYKRKQFTIAQVVPYLGQMANRFALLNKKSDVADAIIIGILTMAKNSITDPSSVAFLD